MDERKVKARANQVLGTVREKAGELTGNEELEAKGRLQKAKAQGKPQELAARAKGEVLHLRRKVANLRPTSRRTSPATAAGTTADTPGTRAEKE